MTDLDAVHNFRDAAGRTPYRAGPGRQFRSGLVYRSGHWGLASAGDYARLDATGIRTVIDLRRRNERDRLPWRLAAGWPGRILAEDGDDPFAEAPHLSFLADPGMTADGIREKMIESYRTYPTDPRLVKLFAATLSWAANGTGPILVHCHAGKDRTGFLVALLHRLAGVAGEDVLADYLISNQAGGNEQRLPQTVAAFVAAYGREPNPDLVRVLMAVEADYLAAAFEVLHRQFASVEDYALKLLGLSPARLDGLKEKLTAPV